ncbi:hypothetical protein K490DRAFT_67290 [Saccharata proteae CBS 121410]|uniref:Uncharacterized protein n=1 Tax=Saccharata proteae CBS 121410 TaxID=1314787 RepID=A0A9P4HQG7_9PEZI|nr:hypothetical protein K490DRAFT_67290 [Saccharata proteae CBS 121410]
MHRAAIARNRELKQHHEDPESDVEYDEEEDEVDLIKTPQRGPNDTVASAFAADITPGTTASTATPINRPPLPPRTIITTRSGARSASNPSTPAGTENPTTAKNTPVPHRPLPPPRSIITTRSGARSNSTATTPTTTAPSTPFMNLSAPPPRSIITTRSGARGTSAITTPTATAPTTTTTRSRAAAANTPDAPAYNLADSPRRTSSTNTRRRTMSTAAATIPKTPAIKDPVSAPAPRSTTHRAKSTASNAPSPALPPTSTMTTRSRAASIASTSTAPPHSPKTRAQRMSLLVTLKVDGKKLRNLLIGAQGRGGMFASSMPDGMKGMKRRSGVGNEVPVKTPAKTKKRASTGVVRTRAATAATAEGLEDSEEDADVDPDEDMGEEIADQGIEPTSGVTLTGTASTTEGPELAYNAAATTTEDEDAGPKSKPAKTKTPAKTKKGAATRKSLRVAATAETTESSEAADEEAVAAQDESTPEGNLTGTATATSTETPGIVGQEEAARTEYEDAAPKLTGSPFNTDSTLSSIDTISDEWAPTTEDAGNTPAPSDDISDTDASLMRLDLRDHAAPVWPVESTQGASVTDTDATMLGLDPISNDTVAATADAGTAPGEDYTGADTTMSVADRIGDDAAATTQQTDAAPEENLADTVATESGLDLINTDDTLATTQLMDAAPDDNLDDTDATMSGLDPTSEAKRAQQHEAIPGLTLTGTAATTSRPDFPNEAAKTQQAEHTPGEKVTDEDTTMSDLDPASEAATALHAGATPEKDSIYADVVMSGVDTTSDAAPTEEVGSVPGFTIAGTGSTTSGPVLISETATPQQELVPGLTLTSNAAILSRLEVIGKAATTQQTEPIPGLTLAGTAATASSPDPSSGAATNQEVEPPKTPPPEGFSRFRTWREKGSIEDGSPGTPECPPWSPITDHGAESPAPSKTAVDEPAVSSPTVPEESLTNVVIPSTDVAMAEAPGELAEEAQDDMAEPPALPSTAAIPLPPPIAATPPSTSTQSPPRNPFAHLFSPTPLKTGSTPLHTMSQLAVKLTHLRSHLHPLSLTTHADPGRTHVIAWLNSIPANAPQPLSPTAYDNLLLAAGNGDVKNATAGTFCRVLEDQGYKFHRRYLVFVLQYPQIWWRIPAVGSKEEAGAVDVEIAVKQELGDQQRGVSVLKMEDGRKRLERAVEWLKEIPMTRNTTYPLQEKKMLGDEEVEVEKLCGYLEGRGLAFYRREFADVLLRESSEGGGDEHGGDRAAHEELGNTLEAMDLDDRGNDGPAATQAATGPDQGMNDTLVPSSSAARGISAVQPEDFMALPSFKKRSDVLEPQAPPNFSKKARKATGKGKGGKGGSEGKGGKGRGEGKNGPEVNTARL